MILILWNKWTNVIHLQHVTISSYVLFVTFLQPKPSILTCFRTRILELVHMRLLKSTSFCMHFLFVFFSYRELDKFLSCVQLDANNLLIILFFESSNINSSYLCERMSLALMISQYAVWYARLECEKIVLFVTNILSNGWMVSIEH